MKKINVALIGAGYIADYHARGLKSQKSVEITAVVGLPLQAAQVFADKYGIKEVTTQVEDLYFREDIDAVIIGTPNKFHAPFAIDFLKNGKDVFLEKPMAMNSEEGIKVIDAAETNKQLVMVGHMWRFDQEVDCIKDLVSSAKIGKIIKTKGYGIHENWGPEGWFTKKELAGGGALADMGVHAIDTVRYILGDPKPKEVYAKIGTHFGNYDVDDSGIVIITWDNGTTSIIESGWWQPHMDGPEASTQLFGTKGYASLFPTQLKFSATDNTEELKLPELNKSEHCDQSIYTRQMEHFVNCIRDRKQPSPGFEEGQIVLNIVDAAYKSAETGLAVKL
jgi:predicted dehydrogenase